MRGANRDLLTSINWPCIRISRWYKEHMPLLHVEKVKYTKAQKASFRNALCVTYIHGTEVVEQNLLCNMKMFDVITLAPASQDPHRPTCTRQFITQGALKDSISSIFSDCYNLFCWKYIYIWTCNDSQWTLQEYYYSAPEMKLLLSNWVFLHTNTNCPRLTAVLKK